MRYWIWLTIGPLSLGLVSLLLLKARVEARALTIASDLIVLTDQSANDEQLARTLTIRIHERFNKPASERQALLLRLQPWLTHRLLPEPLRIRDGAIELLYANGHCDNAARALSLVLATAGIAAEQLNIVTPSNAHSTVVAVMKDNRRILLDPFYGALAYSNDRLIGPEEAHAIARNGASPSSIWIPLAVGADLKFYDEFARASFGRQGEPLEFGGTVTLSQGEPLQLGSQDANGSDVSAAAAKAGLTPYWHYLGHRYDRAWVRRLTMRQETRMIIGLVDDADPKFITSDRPAKIEGKRLIYEIAAGDTVRFFDGHASYSWLRLKSYIDIDYMRFEALTNR